jgi:hypothetical protein
MNEWYEWKVSEYGTLNTPKIEEEEDRRSGGGTPNRKI